MSLLPPSILAVTHLGSAAVMLNICSFYFCSSRNTFMQRPRQKDIPAHLSVYFVVLTTMSLLSYITVKLIFKLVIFKITQPESTQSDSFQSLIKASFDFKNISNFCSTNFHPINLENSAICILCLVNQNKN